MRKRSWISPGIGRRSEYHNGDHWASAYIYERVARAEPGPTPRRCCMSGCRDSFRRRGDLGRTHAWSGNHTHYAERLFTGAQVIGGGELLLPGEVILQPARLHTPWIYGSYGDWLDASPAASIASCGPEKLIPRTIRPVTLNVWEAVYFDQDLDRLVDLAERAAGIGVERYVLDDGWFGGRRDDHAGLGDWTVSPEVWPHGLHPLVDKVTGLGMEFGLWFEPEMINLDSAVARQHPEWIMSTGNRLPVEARHQQVINLAIPSVTPISETRSSTCSPNTRSATSNGTTTAT